MSFDFFEYETSQWSNWEANVFVHTHWKSNSFLKCGFTGFQAQLSILSNGNADANISGDKEGGVGALVDLCHAFISAFNNFINTDA